MSAAASASPAKSGPRSAREALAKQVTALQGQVAKLETELATAETGRNRAVAAASLDGSKAAVAARDAAVGSVVRAEAELAGARAALAQVERDITDLDTRKAEAARAAKLKATGAAVQSLIRHAEQADASAAAFAESFQALLEEVGRLYGTLPAELKEPVFGGGQNLGAKALHSTATFLLSKSSVIARPIFDPSPHRQSLAALVAYFTQPVAEAAAAAPEPETEWE